MLSHHMVIRGGKIANYHPYPPTPWNGSVRDSYGTPGPYEDAVQNTPIFEENPPERFKGIDIMRAVRSFDPCLPCGVHMYLGTGKVLEEAAHAARGSTTEVLSGSIRMARRTQPSASGSSSCLASCRRGRDRGRRPRSWSGCWSSCTATGLTRVVDHRCRSGGDRDAGQRSTEDELVESLLLLHDLHPLDVDDPDPAGAGPGAARTSARTPAGCSTSASTSDGVARLRLEGSCNGCPSSTVTVQLAIEGAVQDGRARGDRGRGRRA